MFVHSWDIPRASKNDKQLDKRTPANSILCAVGTRVCSLKDLVRCANPGPAHSLWPFTIHIWWRRTNEPDFKSEHSSPVHALEARILPSKCSIWDPNSVDTITRSNGKMSLSTKRDRKFDLHDSPLTGKAESVEKLRLGSRARTSLKNRTSRSIPCSLPHDEFLFDWFSPKDSKHDGKSRNNLKSIDYIISASEAWIGISLMTFNHRVSSVDYDLETFQEKWAFLSLTNITSPGWSINQRFPGPFNTALPILLPSVVFAQ